MISIEEYRKLPLKLTMDSKLYPTICKDINGTVRDGWPMVSDLRTYLEVKLVAYMPVIKSGYWAVDNAVYRAFDGKFKND